MKRLRVIGIIGLLALVIVACSNLPDGTNEATPAGTGETSVIITDAISATEPAAQPGEIVVEPLGTAVPGAAAGTIELTMDGSAAAAVDTTGLPVVATVQIIPATAYDNSQPPSPVGLPQHVRVDFAVEGQTDPAAATPVLYIVPTADYAALWEASGDMGVSGTLAGLQALIRERYEPFPEAGIPVLPVERVGSAFNDLAVQGKYVEFGSVSGLRFIGRFVQEGGPVTNEGLTYVFLGFTENGQYFVSFLYPIATPMLPANPDAVDSTELELFYADVDAYMAERVAALNSLAETDWSPSLATLDGLIASLQIPAPAPDDVVATGGSPLTGVSWQWLRTGGPAVDMNVVDPTRYGVVFNEDGTATIQADCNTVLGTYATAADNALTITLGPSTLAACPEDSQDQQFLSELGSARFYFVEGGSLSIEVAEDGTTMQFMTPDQIAQGLVPETSPESATGAAFLTGGLWQWTETSDPEGVTIIDNPAQYTIAFQPDGTAPIQADCNRVIAGYTASDDGGLTIQLGPSTLAACGPETRDTEFLQSLAAVVFYRGEGDALSLEMMADGGVLGLSRSREEAVVIPEGGLTGLALEGPVWQWTVLRQLNGETAVPEPARYTITFNADGTAAIRTDCDVAGATYTAGSDGTLTIAPGPTSTGVACGEGSLDQVFLGGLGAAERFTVDDGSLTITLQLENGSMVFVPVN